MNLEVVVAIAAILSGAFVAYHVAIRQGVFKSRKLIFSLGISPEDLEIPEPVSIILYAIPDIDVDRFLVVLPYLLLSRGDQSIRNAWVQLAIPSARGVTNLEDVYPGDHHRLRFPAMERRARPLGDVDVFDHEHPLIRPREEVSAGEIIQYRREEIYPPPTTEAPHKGGNGPHVVIDRIDVQVIAENYPKLTWEGYIVAVPANDIVELRQKFPHAADLLLEREHAVRLPRLRYAWHLLSGSPFGRRQLLLIEPNFVMALEGLAVEAILAGNPPSPRQPVTAEMRLPWRIRIGSRRP